MTDWPLLPACDSEEGSAQRQAENDLKRVVCGNCIHFLPYRDPNTKRIHPSKYGDYSCDHGIKHWPLSALLAGASYFAPRVRMNPNHDASECQCFKWKAGAEPKAEEQLEIGGVE